jgi:uncharacterized spore protein YtfJ
MINDVFECVNTKVRKELQGIYKAYNVVHGTVTAKAENKMIVYSVVKLDFGHKTNVGVFDTQDKAKAYQSSLELELFDNSNLCGISFEIEECVVV